MYIKLTKSILTGSARELNSLAFILQSTETAFVEGSGVPIRLWSEPAQRPSNRPGLRRISFSSFLNSLNRKFYLLNHPSHLLSNEIEFPVRSGSLPGSVVSRDSNQIRGRFRCFCNTS